jgi:hypothetical protein
LAANGIAGRKRIYEQPEDCGVESLFFKSSQYFQGLSNHLKMIHFSSWPGFVPAIHVFPA